MTESNETFAHEDFLPNLPLPTLDETLVHLKKSLEPLYYADGYYKHPLDPKQISHLDEILNNFKSSNVATILQSTLSKFQLENDSYLDNLHLDVNNHIGTKTIQDDILPRNPFLILADDAIPDINQIDRSAVLVHSALRFISALKKGFLPTDLNHSSKKYLSMYPYLNLFGTTRKPLFQNGEIEKFDLNKPFTISDLDEFMSEEEFDEQEEQDEEDFISHGISIGRYPDSKHILIISRGQYYTLDVLDDEDDIICNISDLAKFLDHVLSDSEINYNLQKESTALGSLTSHSYKNWKYARKRLQKRYPQELHLIDSALFVLILDESQEQIEEGFNNIFTQNDNYFPEFDQERSTNCKRLLYGTSIIDKRGYQIGSCVSRWFDKLQLVVTKDSKAAVIWDSFTCDGSVVLRFASEMYTESVLRLAREVNANDPQFSLWPQVSQTKLNNYKDYSKLNPVNVVSKIDWSFSNILNTHVHLSETKLADLISKYDIVRVSIPLGRKSATRLGIKPDSMVQIALQVAHYALYGQMIFTLEPISTRNFKNSRSSFINIQNKDLLDLCQSFISSSIDSEGKLDKFIQTCERHMESVKFAKEGHCYEKHFNALKNLYKFNEHFKLNLNDEDKSIADALFDSNLIAPFSQPELIAANCGNSATTTFGITPAIPHGFGIGYIIKDDQIDLTVTSQFRQGKRLMFMLNWVLQEIKSFWRAARHTTHNKTGVKISPLVDKLYELDNALNKNPNEPKDVTVLSSPESEKGPAAAALKSHNSHLFNYGFFDMDGNSRSISVTPPRRLQETMDNSGSKLSSRLAELAMSNSNLHILNSTSGNIPHHSSSAISVPTENEKLHTGHEIMKVQPPSLTETPADSDSEDNNNNSSSSSSTKPDSRRRRNTNVINSKFEIDFDRSNVGRKVFAFE
ncbi:carnitine O-acetyltransferase Yat2p [Monosporozyma unispora]